MKIISFTNKGILDATAIATFGINVKDNDSAIGYFGTGLKYAIAVILREGCGIVIEAGNQRYKFKTVTQVVRGKQFDVICMNDTPLGFTTELGKNWKMWQAFRELYCNALDEDGAVNGHGVDHDQAGTTVTVTGDKFFNAYAERGDIVLDTECLVHSSRCTVHRGESKFVFYKNIRITDAMRRSAFTYNIKSGLDITEDRTAKYEHQLKWHIANVIITSKDKSFISDALLVDRQFLEHHIDLTDAYDNPSEEFLQVAACLRLNLKVNRTVFNVLSKYNRLPAPEAVELTGVQVVMLERAVKFCKTIGYPVDKYAIVTSRELKGGMHGLAEATTIYLSQDTFGMGTKYLASTLIEEYLHLHTGYGDMTRELQSLLFNDIVSLGEQLIGEPV